MDVVATLIADAKASETVKPRECALDHPANNSQPASVLAVASCDQSENSHLAKFLAMRLGIVGMISDQHARLMSGTPAFSPNRRNRIEERNESRNIMGICTC